MSHTLGTAGAIGNARALLVFGPDDPVPDLTAIVQFLLDDLRAEGRQVTHLWLSDRGAHLVFDGQDLTVSRMSALRLRSCLFGAMRPMLTPGAIRPDPLRARLARDHAADRQGLIVSLRLGGSPTAAADLTMAQIARHCLLPMIEAAPPFAVLWQPRMLLFSPAELIRGDAGLLMATPDPQTALATDAHATLRRPADRIRPAHPRLIRPRPHTRAQRAARASAGRLFGAPGQRVINPLPRPDRALARLKAALRGDDHAETPRPAPLRALRIYAVAAQWVALVPQLLGFWMPYA